MIYSLTMAFVSRGEVRFAGELNKFQHMYLFVKAIIQVTVLVTWQRKP